MHFHRSAQAEVVFPWAAAAAAVLDRSGILHPQGDGLPDAQGLSGGEHHQTLRRRGRKGTEGREEGRKEGRPSIAVAPLYSTEVVKGRIAGAMGRSELAHRRHRRCMLSVPVRVTGRVRADVLEGHPRNRRKAPPPPLRVERSATTRLEETRAVHRHTTARQKKKKNSFLGGKGGKEVKVKHSFNLSTERSRRRFFIPSWAAVCLVLGCIDCTSFPQETPRGGRDGVTLWCCFHGL